VPSSGEVLPSTRRYGVPVFEGTMKIRPTMDHWARTQIERGKIEEYRSLKNSRSLDGLVGMKAARADLGHWLFVGEFLAWMRRMAKLYDAVLVGVLLGVALMVAVQTLQRAEIGWVVGHVDH